jgi:glycosyltransferase involved in cell wall biosynthesis
MSSVKLSIVIATYQRNDGKTPTYLRRALDSVFNQTHQNFKIFLIGDKYEDNDEITSLVSEYDSNKLYFENLPYAKERDAYEGFGLWYYGGVNATNIGVDKSLSEGFEYICHLDHDDTWSEDHLMEISKCIESTSTDWVCTKSKYLSDRILPVVIHSEHYTEFLPRGRSLIHSSVCMNFKTIPLKYRDILGETGQVGEPADADLWDRCREYILKHNLKSYVINKLTCYHEEEGYERN